MYSDPIKTKARADELLSYNPLTGLFTWKVDRRYAVKEGDIAGCVKSAGYRYIQIDKKSHRAHRLAWLVTYGDWPEDSIDHINGSRDDNRIENLRDVTTAQNSCNRTRPTGISGLLGVNYKKLDGRWSSYITRKGKTRVLGTFTTKEQAYAVYLSERESERLHVFGPNAAPLSLPVVNLNYLET